MVDNTDQALERTCFQTMSSVREYTIGPIFMTEQQKGGHEWIVEFEKEPNNVKRFASLLDKNMQRLNSDYEAKRYRDMTLKTLELRVVPPGTFEKWMRLRGKFGNQNKVPRLANHRHYLNEILPIGRSQQVKP